MTGLLQKIDVKKEINNNLFFSTCSSTLNLWFYEYSENHFYYRATATMHFFYNFT